MIQKLSEIFVSIINWQFCLRSEMNLLPLVDEFDDDTDIDHPMLKDTHILGIIGGVLAILCVCLYLGIIIWRRTIL